MLSARNHLFPAFATITILAIINSCSKLEFEPSSTKEKIVAQTPFRLIEAGFKAGGYEQTLIKRFNDTANVYLKAAWSAAYSQTSATGIIYTYVPLTARLYSEKSKRWISAYEEMGMERFILCRHINGKQEFSLATYMEDRQPDKDTFSPSKHNINFSSFSGTVSIVGLSGNSNALIYYKHGVITQPTSGTTKNKTTGCSYYTVCGWYAWCSATGVYWYVETTGQNGYCSEPTGSYCQNSAMGWSPDNTTNYPQCSPDYDPNPPCSGCNTDTGGGIRTLSSYLDEDNFALFGPCPGLDDYRPLINFKPSIYVTNRLNYLTNNYTSWYNLIPSWKIQSIQNAGGLAVNLDLFSLTLTELPTINNHQLSIEEFQEYIRTHLNTFITSGSTNFSPHPLLMPAEESNWNNHMLGSIISIYIGLDDGSVILSDYDAFHWTFSTITDPYNLTHPVSGNRTFGVYATQGGSFTYNGSTISWPTTYTFYIQGADRVNYLSTQLIGQIGSGSITPSNNLQFSGGDRLWSNVVTNIAGWANSSHPNTASVNPPVTMRPSWAKVIDAINNNTALTLPCPY